MTEALVRVGSGREADIFIRDEATVTKVWRNASEERALAEQSRLRDVRAAGIRAPEPFELVQVDGRPGLVVERLEGANLHSRLVRNPLSVFRVAATLAHAQHAIHVVRAAPSLPSLHHVIGRRLGDSEVDLASAARRELDRLPVGTATLHGNLHLGNVMTTRAGNIAVDWADAAAGDPHAEVALTLVRYCVATVGRDDPTALRVMQSSGRLLLRHAYRSAYASLTVLDDELVRRWVGVQAVARLTEGNTGEEATLRHLAARLR
jgi:hypothetical protein